MTTLINDDARHPGGWPRRRRQDGETHHRTEAPKSAMTEAADAHWLDEGGAVDERSDRVSFRRLR